MYDVKIRVPFVCEEEWQMYIQYHNILHTNVIEERNSFVYVITDLTVEQCSHMVLLQDGIHIDEMQGVLDFG